MQKLIIPVFLFITTGLLAQINIDRIDAIVQKEISENYFEGSVLIAEKGKVAYQKSVGLANRKTGKKILDDTRFSIASITKMLTAIITLQLVEEGKLSLDTNLKTLLPEFKIPNAENITPHHLMLHISGLPNEKDWMYQSLQTPQSFVKGVLGSEPKSSTFGQFNYANIDYVLLGLITEKLTGQSWQHNVQTRIIEKLGLNNTGFLRKGKYPEGFAWTYTLSEEGTFIPDSEYFAENFYAAGCMYSNAADLLTIDQAMYGTALLSAASKTQMYTSYPEYNYTAYSVWVYNYPFAETQPKVMERRGGIMGANVLIMRLLESNKTVIILSNNNRFNPDSFGNTENFREAILVELGKETAILKAKAEKTINP